MTWFTESPTPIYVIAGIVGVGFLLAFYSTGRTRLLIGVGAAAGLALLAWLIDFLVVTDREMIETKLEGMLQAAEKGDVRRFDEFFSPDFAVPEHALTRQKLMNESRPYLAADPRRRIRISNMDVLPAKTPGEYECDGLVQASGRFGPYDASGEVVRVKLTFKKDTDGQWRIRYYQVFFFDQRLVVPQ